MKKKVDLFTHFFLDLSQDIAYFPHFFKGDLDFVEGGVCLFFCCCLSNLDRVGGLKDNFGHEKPYEK